MPKNSTAKDDLTEADYALLDSIMKEDGATRALSETELGETEGSGYELSVGDDAPLVDEIRILTDRGLSPEDWEVCDISINEGPGWYRGGQGEDSVTIQVTRISYKFRKKIKPVDPLVPGRLAGELKVVFPPAVPLVGQFATDGIYPDQQFGYRLVNINGKPELVPIQDELALACGTNIMAAARPTNIINLGDVFDFAMMSRFLSDTSFSNTAQYAIDRGYREFALQREIVGPGGDVVFVFGNHDDRLNAEFVAKFPEAHGLTQADQPDSLPVMSLQHLLRLDELNVKWYEYRKGSLANGHWCDSGTLKYVHGDSVASQGSTAASYLKKHSNGYSLMFGHIHSIEAHYQDQELANGERVTVFAASPGTLARVDGAVPGFNTGLSSDGKERKTITNWQQGIAFVHYIPGKPHSEELEIVRIKDGKALYHGQVYEG